MKALEDGEPLVDQLRDLAQRRPQDANRLFRLAIDVNEAVINFRTNPSPGNLRALNSIYARGIRVFEDVSNHAPPPTEPPIQRLAMAA